MAEIGSGSGTSFPSALDTNATLESSTTLARADVPNDLAACIVAIETELGTNPKGTKADVKTFLQTEHNTNGTHGVITTTGGAKLDGSGYFTKNLLKNGCFRVAQRGTSIATPVTDTYTLDQWTVLLESAGTLTSIAQGTTAIDASSNSCDMTVSTNGKKFGIINFIEAKDAHRLHTSGICSLSFQAKVSSAAANHLTDIRAAVLQWGSTADTLTSAVVSTWGTASAGISAYAANWTSANTPSNLGVATTLTKFKIENIAITGTSNLAVFIWSDGMGSAQSGDILYISDVQLEVGPVATQYEWLPYQQTLSMCQRYLPSFKSIGTVDFMGLGYTTSTSGGNLFYKFPVTPRIPVTGITVSAVANFTMLASNTATSAVTVMTFGFSSLDACQISVTGTGTPYTANMPAQVYSNSASGYVLFTGAEL